MTRKCDNCERHVSEAYYRVFEVEGVLYGCIHCRGVVGGYGHKPSADDG